MKGKVPKQDAAVLKHLTMANLNYAVVVDARPGERRTALTCTVLANAFLEAERHPDSSPTIYERVTKGWRKVE